MITGGVDAIAKFENEEGGVIVDWKTSASPSHPAWNAQLHLYHYLISKKNPCLSPRFLIVMLDKRGNAPQVFNYQLNASILRDSLQCVEDFWDRKSFLLL